MKNRIYILLLSVFVAFTAQAQVLNVPTIQQEQDLWCWNGVCKSALDYYGIVIPQCEIAEWVRTVSSRGFGSQNCCENPTGPCNNGNSIYNENGSMQDILLHYANITSAYKGQFGRTEADLANAIARNAVVPCGWTWSTGIGAGHAVLAHGYVNGNVYYMDPWFGEGKKIATYSAFSSGNDGSAAGNHTWTQGLYFTSDVSQVNPVPCATPSNLSVSNVSGTTVTLAWSVEASALSYKVRYRIQGTSNWSSVNAASNSAAISNLSATSIYEFQVSSVCNSVSESAFTASVVATTLTGPLVYCSSKGTSVTAEWIKTVAFGSINNTSNANAGYGNFTSISNSITAGTAQNIVLTPGFASNWLYGTTTQPEFWSVWIDLNQDGDFSDANEQRFVSSTSSTTAVTASISIPSGTLPGTTRMRIAMKRGAASNACETFANGEVEDYALSIIADVPPTCDIVSNLATSNVSNNSLVASWSSSTNASSYIVEIRAAGGSWVASNQTGTTKSFSGLLAETTYEIRVQTVCSFGNSGVSNSVNATTASNPVCSTPSGLAVNNVTNTSLVASWNSSANASSYAIEIRSAGGSWTSSNQIGTSKTFSGLLAETQYELRVSSVCSFGTSSVSASVSATTLAEPVVTEYCSASGTTVNEWIKTVKLGSINNTSNANGGYADFTSQSTNINAGSSATITLTPGFPPAFLYGFITQAEFWSVWIDLNQDGDFEDANEQRFVSTSSSTAVVTASISIPASAKSGETRLRVAMKRGLAASACEGYSFGEVEDYSINIIGGSGFAAKSEVSVISEVLSSSIFPNPATDLTTVVTTIPANSGIVQFTMVDLAGNVLTNTTYPNAETTQILSETLQLGTLPKGVYLIQVRTETGATQNQKLLVR